MIKPLAFLLTGFLFLSGCSELELGSHLAKTWGGETPTQVGDFKVGNPYRIKGRLYEPKEVYDGSETGIASWYGPGFHGKQTANGEIFNRNDLTAAHRTLQMPSIVRVTNLENGRSLIVRVNDRGPFARDRVIDLSERAADLLGFKTQGTARVRIDVLENESRMVASAAKNGVSTRGVEVAMNRREPLPHLARTKPTPVSKPVTAQTQMAAVYSAPQPVQAMPASASFDDMISRHVLNDRKPGAMPERQVARRSVPPQSDVFVQAGAFASEDNAMTLKNALYTIREPVNVYRTNETGAILYKVKIGPMRDVEKANEILTLLNNQGRGAKIVSAALP